MWNPTLRLSSGSGIRIFAVLLTLTGLAAFFVALTAVPGFASQDLPTSPICGTRSELVDKLKNQYSERPVATGLATNGGIIEVLASPTGNSWTIVLTMPNGTSCLIAAGENWETAAKLASGKGI